MGVHERMPGSAWMCAWAYMWARVDASGRMRGCTWVYVGMSVRPCASVWAYVYKRIARHVRTHPSHGEAILPLIP